MRAAILAVLAATCQALVFPPFGWTWLAWLAALPLLAIFPAPRARAAAAAVWLFGTLWALAVVAPWMTPALGALFDLTAVETASLLFLVCQGGLPFALLGLVLHVGRPATPLGRVLFAPAAWVGVEYLRAHVPFGTPWAVLGLALAERPIVVQIADLGGAYAISFVLVLTSAALAEGLAAGRGGWRRAAPALLLAAVVVASVAAYGAVRRDAIRARMVAAPTARVALVHAEIPNAERRDPRLALASLERYLALDPADDAAVDLVVWPENAVPLLLEENPGVVARVAARSVRAPRLIGAPRVVAAGGHPALRASAFLIGPAGILEVYDKHRLLPLAETMPSFGGGGLTAARGFTPGGGTSILTVGDLRLGPLVCYEFIFPELPRAAVRAGAALLVNLSNDSWFQPGAGPRQHFLFGRLRAVELRRTLVRAANRGPTAIVLPDGSSELETDGRTAGVEIADVPLLQVASVYATRGDLFAGICLGLVAGVLAARASRRWARRTGRHRARDGACSPSASADPAAGGL